MAAVFVFHRSYVAFHSSINKHDQKSSDSSPRFLMSIKIAIRIAVSPEPG